MYWMIISCINTKSQNRDDIFVDERLVNDEGNYFPIDIDSTSIFAGRAIPALPILPWENAHAGRAKNDLSGSAIQNSPCH